MMIKAILCRFRCLTATFAFARTPGGVLIAIVMGGLLMTADNGAAQTTITGYGHYCSMTWPSGGWAFTSDTNGNDPCKFIAARSDPGGTIQRAGIYNATGMNTAIARCADNAVWLYRGNGNGPLTAAFNSAKGRRGCIFTVAPQDLPIFNNPFDRNAKPSTAAGFDFAKPPYNTLNVADFGQSGSANEPVVNLRGAPRPGWLDNHDAYDWAVPEGTRVYTLAAGVVEASRDFDTKCTNSKSPIQGEVYIRHTVVRAPSTYNEVFVAGYFHLGKRAKLAAGQWVPVGTYLGDVSWVGCSSGPHLHFAVIRITNVAGYRFAPFSIPNNGANNGGRWVIDPYGFIPPKNIDPWGWRGFPDGALSINLWKSGQAPPLGGWGP
jgi:murein DD-endopeptidase MepM/ murein hydrolase activator NlpD